MTTPRVVVDLDKVGQNARTLVTRLGAVGITVTGVTKVALGAPELGRVLVDAGVVGLGDSRVANLERLREADIDVPLTLLRSPSLSDVDRVVDSADVSCNTELEVVRALSCAAVGKRRVHGILAMVELGDLREGILAEDLLEFVRGVLRLPGCRLAGIGTNLACRAGVVPDDTNMGQLAALAELVTTTFGIRLDLVSGGNSANIAWATSSTRGGSVNNLRIGESMLLGRETLHRTPIDGLATDAVTLVAEVIESRTKPSMPWGHRAQSAFGHIPAPVDRGPVVQSLLAIGRQDVDPEGLVPPVGLTIVAASSDHLVVTSAEPLSIGSEIVFAPDYGALLRAMTSPFVIKRYVGTT